jgi:predicted amidophosphoribosyltransferase
MEPTYCPSCGATLERECCRECGWYADEADEPLEEVDCALLTLDLSRLFTPGLFA